MSWTQDLKVIIDRMPDDLPSFAPRGIGRSGEPYVRHKVQRRRNKTYHYWTVGTPKSRQVRYFPYTAEGLCEALIYRDTMMNPADPYIEELKQRLITIRWSSPLLPTMPDTQAHREHSVMSKRERDRINQQRRRERLYRERGPIPLAQTPEAIYMRAYRRGVRKRAQS